jgi:hypothetical protein
MGSVLQFRTTDVPIFDRAFDAETTALICQAFDLTCRELHDRGQPAVVTEIIARRLIEIAGRGERDPEKIREAALFSIGIRCNEGGRFATL